MKQIIYLEYQDTIATIREKLERAQTNEVVLVVPSRFPVLRQPVNLKLLKRYAQNLALDLALVVRDSATQVLAREEGFVLLPQADRAREIRVARTAQPQAGTGALPMLRGPMRAVAPRRAGTVGRVLSVLFLIALLGGLSAAFVYLALPAATVALVPATRQLEAEMEVVAIPGLAEIDYGAGRIPASSLVVEIEANGETVPTDKRDIPDARAQGTVVFANKTRDAVVVPRGTFVRTGAGTPVRFYTVTDVTLPAEWGSHARVSVIAVDPGPAGNVTPLTINQVEGDMSFRVDVINDDRTHGGGVRRVSVISLEDQVRLKAELVERAKQEAYNRLQDQLSAMEFIPAETMQLVVVDEEYSAGVGETVDALALRVKIRASGTLVGGTDANTLMLRMLEREMPDGYRIVAPTLRFVPGEVLATEGAAVRFRMKASGMAINDIDATEVRRAIGGKSVDDALIVLQEQWDLAEEPQLEVTPEWIARVPWLPYRVRVQIDSRERS